MCVCVVCACYISLEFHESKQSDSDRLQRLMCTTANPDHPYANFVWGTYMYIYCILCVQYHTVGTMEGVYLGSPKGLRLFSGVIILVSSLHTYLLLQEIQNH